MQTAVITALLVSVLFYLAIGIRIGLPATSLGDLLPIITGRRAKVDNSRQFSTSTVATTISLATVVMAYFELAAYFGIWLFWTVITTAAGIFLVRLVARRIWRKMNAYDHRPTLHEFLGKEYGSNIISIVAASATGLGFLGAFAVELTVGSRFLASLVPNIPMWMGVVVLSAVAFVYTSVGGFRAVIITDRFQMGSIWLMLAALLFFYVANLYFAPGYATASLSKIPDKALQLSWRGGLTSFLIGIFIINVPTYIADMSIWQRIAGVEKPKDVYQGLFNSVISVTVTWGLLVILAISAFMFIQPVTGENPLSTLIKTIGQPPAIDTSLIVFIISLGLYGAMLSTASTQLIAASHTIYEDLLSRSYRKIPLADRLQSSSEVRLSRLLLIGAALISTIIVGLLQFAGFSIADLVFAIYGAQLGLATPVILALFFGKAQLTHISQWGSWGIILGFIGGWGAAITGKIIGSSNLVFLAPAVSLVISAMLLGIGMLANRSDIFSTSSR